MYNKAYHPHSKVCCVIIRFVNDHCLNKACYVHSMVCHCFNALFLVTSSSQLSCMSQQFKSNEVKYF